jgi:Flp pilus assembly protein TadD
LKPDLAVAHDNLGVTLQKLGRLEEAATSYRQLITLQPDNAEAHNNLGTMLQNLGRFEGAETSYRQAVVLKPDLAVAHYNLGVTLQKLGRLEEAEANSRQAIALDPGYVEAHINLGVTLQKLGRLEESEASCRKALVLKSDSAEAYVNLGVVLNDLGRLNEAEASCRQALGLEPDSVEIYINLGITLRRLGRLEEAEASYRQALVLQSNSAEAHNCLGVTLQELGRLDEAEASYGQALALQSDYAEALKNLGVLLLESGQFKKTVTFYQDNKNKNKNSQTHLLKCFYELDDRIQFYKQLDFLIEKGEVNPTIGSLTSRAENRYGIRKINTFAIEPFKYVVRTDLIKKCDFKNTFVEAMHNILNKESLSIRNQGLLSKGQQTAGNIFLIDTDLIRKVEKIIRSGIGDYQAKFKNSKEGFLVAWPKKYSLKGWLISMKSGGHLAPHIHEAGWLSGAVYINVPAKKQPDSGNFVLCTDAAEPKKMDEKNGHKVIDIATGDLVLFPASLMHYTIPFESEEQRIVLAFDVMPE